MGTVVKEDVPGCLIEEATLTTICEHLDDTAIHQPQLTPAQVLAIVGPHVDPATTIPIADNEVDTAIRTGQVGTSTLYARADHNHPIRRQANPGDPVVTVTGATLNQSVILDRFSDEESYSYRFRVLVSQAAGIGWGFIAVPTKAGFQQPKFSEVNGYRSQSVAPQDDDTGNGNGFGASPRGPYMGENPTHWSSTNRLYLPHYRRDNAFVTYVGFIVTYVRS